MYVLTPYERGAGPAGRAVRRCRLARVLPAQSSGSAEPFIEAEGLGGFAVALILDDSLRQQAAATPGVLAFPRIPLTSTLGDVGPTVRAELRDAAAAMGYTMAEIRQALGADLASVTLLRLLRFMVSRRRKPRFDFERDEIVLDGEDATVRDLPLPPFAGAAFPTTGVLDTFTGADGTSPPSGNWTNKVFGGPSEDLRIISNQVGKSGGGSSGSAWWSASTFGPQSEGYTTLSTQAAGGSYFGVFARIQQPGNASTIDDYEFYAISGGGAEFYRTDNGAGTQLGATISQTWSNGDGVGIECDGSTIRGHRRSSGVWSEVGNRSDGTYAGAGFIGLYMDGGTTARGDDFGGGTTIARTRRRRRGLMGVGR